MKPHRPAEQSKQQRKQLVENLDFYFENGLMVLTAHFLLNRGYCCGNGCRHCPYQTNGAPEQNDSPVSQRTQ